MNSLTRIGVVGTGFIARGFILSLKNHKDLVVSRILTRRDLDSCRDFPGFQFLTNSKEELLENSDLIFECSGDVLHAADVILAATKADLPVVTMDAEFHVTVGSYFVGRGLVTEAEGDQPGCLAYLKESAVQMGFSPLVYGNIKGFLNYDPSQEEMLFWSRKQGIRLDQVVSFTDGTKIQIEQAFVANGLGATIYQKGLIGIKSQELSVGINVLSEKAKEFGRAISDYVLCSKGPAGIFIVAEHNSDQKEYLHYLKMGNGPFYVLLQNYHLCHLEIVKTIRRVLNGKGILLDNSPRPMIGVAAIAKKTLFPGDAIQKGIGSFEVRGEALGILDYPDHIPIGLLSSAIVKRTVKKGEIVEIHDIELSESFALWVWLKIKEDICNQNAAKSLAF